MHDTGTQTCCRADQPEGGGVLWKYGPQQRECECAHQQCCSEEHKHRAKERETRKQTCARKSIGGADAQRHSYGKSHKARVPTTPLSHSRQFLTCAKHSESWCPDKYASEVKQRGNNAQCCAGNKQCIHWRIHAGSIEACIVGGLTVHPEVTTRQTAGTHRQSAGVPDWHGSLLGRAGNRSSISWWTRRGFMKDDVKLGIGLRGIIVRSTLGLTPKRLTAKGRRLPGSIQRCS